MRWPATLNAELGILRRILKRARLWARVADDIRPLKEPSTIGRALTEDDKQRLLKTAVMRPEWETAYLAAILCLNTTSRGCELKGLQWDDVNLFSRTLTFANQDGGRGADHSADRRRLLCSGEATDPGGILRPCATRALHLCRICPEVHFSGKKVVGTTSLGLTRQRMSIAGGRLGGP